MRSKKQGATASTDLAKGPISQPGAKFPAGSCRFCGLPTSRCKATVDTISASGNIGYIGRDYMSNDEAAALRSRGLIHDLNADPSSRGKRGAQPLARG